ncbi:CshA/CshB family fibrillar adhesin-related protein [Pedobacter nototheniae]|uniref:CshA/CshB family fibrillar adhesin-related protein n=1 Tax=Pedobacter nototheniae TaxID=2488994 RepID=UPI00292E8381|nr:CshA/CshB family fibrillar adhesin-related protein [Pedobacter nototheniae]
MNRIILKKVSLILLLVAFSHVAFAQCFPTQPKTAAFATGGTSKNKNQVLWLTWGSTLANVATYPYGRYDQPLVNGSASYASIDVGGGRYLCVQAVISGLIGSDIKSYAPGNYSGDSMDDMYNIGGTGTNNKLINGIRNGTDGGLSTFTVTCTATLDGVPVKLGGMVIGDAESLAAREYFNATADGKWNIVELQKNLSSGAYQIRKVNVTPGTQQRIEFVSGNDNNTAAVSFLTFNQTAYAATTFDVSFSVTLKGGGLTAIALGLLPPGVDGGDAPASYGSPLHMIDALAISSDGISATTALGATTNLNTSAYTPGALIPPVSDFLGTTGPDMDTGPLFSKDAMGDNNNGSAGVNEEDAWPAKYKSFSYKANYMPGNIITAAIPYKGSEDAYISGWIDFNQNGIFEDSERVTVAAPANQTSVNLTWTVPISRVVRSTYVRLRYAKNQNDLLSPTSATPGGEVEDHKIFIQGPAITNPMLPSKAKKN